MARVVDFIERMTLNVTVSREALQHWPHFPELVEEEEDYYWLWSAVDEALSDAISRPFGWDNYYLPSLGSDVNVFAWAAGGEAWVEVASHKATMRWRDYYVELSDLHAPILYARLGEPFLTLRDGWKGNIRDLRKDPEYRKFNWILSPGEGS